MDIDKIKEDSAKLKDEVREKTVGYIVAALSLVAGLAWGDAMKAIIEYFFPLSQDGVWAKILYAGIVTLAVIIASFYLSRAIKKK